MKYLKKFKNIKLNFKFIYFLLFSDLVVLNLDLTINFFKILQI